MFVPKEVKKKPSPPLSLIDVGFQRIDGCNVPTVDFREMKQSRWGWGLERIYSNPRNVGGMLSEIRFV